MFKLIKWLLLLAIIAAIFFAVTGKKIGGKTLDEHLTPILGKGAVTNAMHDIRALVGEGLKAAGEAVSEDVTIDERKQLDDLVKQELQKGSPVQMLPGQTALPAQVQPLAPAVQPPAGRPSVKQQLEAMPAPTPAPVAPAAPAALPGMAAPAPVPAPAPGGQQPSF